MAIRLECDDCGELHRLNPRLRGRTIRCKRCDAPIEVPKLKRGGGGAARRRRQDDWEDDGPNILPWILGGGAVAAVAVIGLVVLLMRGPGGLGGGDDGWKPDTLVEGKLNSEVAIDRYAVRLPADFQLVEYEERDNATRTTEVMWQGPQGAFHIMLKTHPSFVGMKKPNVRINERRIVHTGHDPLLNYSEADVDEGNIGDFDVTRIKIDHDKINMSMGPPHDGGPRQYVYVVFDEDRCIQMSGSVAGGFDSDEFELVEGIARTLRRTKPGEVIPSPRERDAESKQRNNPIVRNDPARPVARNIPAGNPGGANPVPPIQPRQPFVPPRIEGNGFGQANPAAGADGKLRIPLPNGHRSRVLRAEPVGPFVCIDADVYDLRNQQRVGHFSVPVEAKPKEWSLSADGGYLAWTSNDLEGEVHIYKADGGQPIVLRPDPDDLLRAVEFLNEKEVLLSFQVKGDSRNLVIDAATGKVAREFALDNHLGDAAISPDGKYAARTSARELLIIDLEKGQPVGRMQPPPNPDGFPFSPVEGMAFSPTGTEFAALVGERFTVWSANGTIAFDQVVPDIDSSIYYGKEVAWLPDGQGWILGGKVLLDRASRQVVWRIETATFYDYVAIEVVDQDTLGVAIPDPVNRKSGLYVGVTIPHDQIAAATGRINAADAILKPGGSVSLDLRIGEVRFSTPEAVKAEFQRILAARLARDRISIAANQEAVLVVDYSEKAGETKKVVSGPFGGTDTGQTVVETEGEGTIQLLRRGSDKPIWSRRIGSDGGLFIEGEISDASVRKRMFSFVTRRLAGIQLPYFVSDAGNLPIVTKVGGAR